MIWNYYKWMNEWMNEWMNVKMQFPFWFNCLNDKFINENLLFVIAFFAYQTSIYLIKIIN